MTQDLQSTFFEGKIIQQNTPTTSTDANRLSSKTQGIVIGSRQNRLVDGKSISKSIKLIDSTPQAPVINLCDSDDEVENTEITMPIVEILDSDDDVANDETVDNHEEKTTDVPTELNKSALNDKKENESSDVVTKEVKRRRMPRRRGIIVSRGRIFRTRREKILKRKRKSKGRKRISEGSSEPESSSDGSRQRQSKPCISVDLVSSTIVEQSPYNRTPSPNSVTSSNNYPASSSNADTVTSFSFFVEQLENEAKVSEKQNENESLGSTSNEKSSQMTAETSGKERPESSENLIGEIFNPPEMEDLNEICSNVSDTPLEDDFLEQPHEALAEAISENELPESGKSSRTATPVLDEKPVDEDTRCLDEQPMGSKYERVIFSTTFKGHLFAEKLEECAPVGVFISDMKDTEEEVVENDQVACENNKNLSNSHELTDNGVLADDKRCEIKTIEMKDSKEERDEEKISIHTPEDGKKFVQQNSDDKISVDSGIVVENKCGDSLNESLQNSIPQEPEEEYPETETAIEETRQEHNEEKSPESNDTSEITPEVHMETKEIETDELVSEIEPCDKNECVEKNLKDLPNKEDEENDVANNSTREETEITEDIVQDISQDEDDIPLMNLSNEKEGNFRDKKLHRRLKHKPAGTYCEDSLIIYDGIRPCGKFTEELTEEIEPKIIETQQDFMELIDLMPREKVFEKTEEIIENEKIVKNVEETIPTITLTIAKNKKKEDIPNTAIIHETEEIITNLPDQCENVQTFDKGFNQNTETTQIPIRSCVLESPVLNVLMPESFFSVNNSTVFEESERKIEGHRKSLKARKKISGKKISKKKRHKCLQNDIIKTPLLKSALKSPSTPPSPHKRRVSFNLEMNVVVPEDFSKSSDDSSCSHRRKSKESKKKRKYKECPTDGIKDELDVELQKRFSQCLSIVDLPNETETVEEFEKYPDCSVETNEIERLTSVASDDGNMESEETNTLEKDETDQEGADEEEKLPEIKEYDEYEEVSGEISTPEGADFMNEEDENDAESLDNVEVVPNVIDEKKETDEEEFADEAQHPIEFRELSEKFFVSSSDEEAEGVLADPIVNLRNKLKIKQVEVKLEKIVDSKKFCKRRGLKYISPDRQSHSHIEIKKKKSKKCKHKHKKRRKSRRESREMVIEDEMTEEEEVKGECKRAENEATEEEICEMSPPESATPDSSINLMTPVPEKSPGSLKLKVRSQDELLMPEMKQMQQEEHVELDCDQRLDLFLLTDETNSNVKNFERWNDYLRKIYGDDTKTEAAKSKADTKTETAKSKDVTTPYTEESPGVDRLECLVLNDGMGSTMPIDVPRKDGSIEIRRVPEQLVNPSEILAPKKSTPEPPVECTNFYDSGSVKNISGESFGETSHVQSSSSYVAMLSFDDIMECEETTSHEETVSYEETCEVVSQSYLTPLSSQHDNEFATINKKDLADIKSVSIPPAFDILRNSALTETEKVPEPDKSCDGSNESLGSWNSISLEFEDTGNKVVTEGESTCLVESKKCQEKIVKAKSKGEKVMTKAQQKETPQLCLPIKCNERIPVSKHILIKSRSTSTYTTSKTTITLRSPSPLPQTVLSIRESKEKTPQSLFDMPQLGHESPEVAKSPVVDSVEQPKKSSDELFDQLKELYTPTSIMRKRTHSLNDIEETTSPVEAQQKSPVEIPCQPPPAKIAKIYPHVVEKNNLPGRNPGQQPFKRDPFKNPKISSSTTSAEAKSRDSIVKELGVPATVDDSTLLGKIVKKLSELDSRPTPMSYKEHKELKEKKESLKKHLEILSAKLKHSSSRSVSSRPVALVSPSSSNHRARTMVAMASSSFDRFRTDVASSSTSSTPTKVRPQASDRQASTSRRQPETWKPENIPTETIIEEYQQKAREKQEARNKPSKRHHYVFT